jgi:adenylosuccinate lyase
MTDRSIYQSPFSWRYGSPEMREIWSLEHTRRLWREIWLALAEVQAAYDLVSEEQLSDLKAHAYDLDIERSLLLESQLQHDLMAELEVLASQCPRARGILHLGATSMDIKDNASVMQQKQALDLLLEKIRGVLASLADLVDAWADQPLIAFTHLQPAEPSTLGYRLAQSAQDLLNVFEGLTDFSAAVRSKGFTGAVGSSASFSELVGQGNLEDFQERLSQKLELDFFPVVSQTYPRLQDFQLLSLLAGLGAALYKFAYDLRILQSPGFSELAEPFGEQQVGSSAMPFKRNPIKSEKINSLGRYLAQFPRVAWDNAAQTILERTLDDSANRRMILPEAFLCAEEMLITCREILEGLVVNEGGIERNLERYGPFAATEKLLMELCKAGADRGQMHAIMRKYSLEAWAAVQQGEPNPLVDLVAGDAFLQGYLDEASMRNAMQGKGYLGDAPVRARRLAAEIKEKLSS